MNPRLPSLLAVLGVAALLPAAASAAAVPDRVLDEVSSLIDVGIDGSVVAYTHRVGTRGIEVVVRDGDRPAVRLAAGRGSSPVDVGRDGRGRRVVVYLRCRSSCDLIAYQLTARRSRVVARGVKALDLTVGAGRVFLADGRRVRSRSLLGGRDRAEAVAGAMSPTELDTDGTTLAVTGAVPGDEVTEATGLSITRVGSGRARLRARRAYSQDYAAYRAPVVTARGVTTLFDSFVAGVSTAFADIAAGSRAIDERGTGGMQILTWAASGRRAVLVEAPSEVGCELGEQLSERSAGPAPCRIVLADLSRERLLPPRIAIDDRTATVIRTKLRGGSVTGRLPVAGVAVTVRDGAKLVASLTTDARGKVTLPENEVTDGLAVEAATTPRSYAYDASPG